MFVREFEKLEVEKDLETVAYIKKDIISKGVIYVVDNYQFDYPVELNLLKLPTLYEIDFIEKTLKHKNNVDKFKDILTFEVRYDAYRKGYHYRMAFSILKENSTDVDYRRMEIITFSYLFLYSKYSLEECLEKYSQILDYYKSQLEFSKTNLDLEIESLQKLKTDIV